MFVFRVRIERPCILMYIKKNQTQRIFLTITINTSSNEHSEILFMSQ